MPPYDPLTGSGPGGAYQAGDKWGSQTAEKVRTNFDEHQGRLNDVEETLAGGAGTGDVSAAATITDNAIVRGDGGAKGVQTSGITIADGSSGTLSGTNTGNVSLITTLADYLSIAGQVISLALIDLAAHVTGRLPWSNVVQAPAASRLVGRGSASGAGDWEPIAVGPGLAFDGTTLKFTGSGTGATELDGLDDVVITTPSNGQVLQHNGSEWINDAIPSHAHSAAELTSGTIPDARMPDLTGDVTTSVGAVATTIANDAVTNAKAANMAQATIKGRAAGAGTGDPTDLTPDQASTILDAATDPFVRTSAATGGSIVRTVGITIGGGGSVISTGVKGFVRVPFTGTITKVTLLSTDPSATAGSIVIDVWKDSYANFPPDNSDSITASAPPTLSSANKAEDSTLTGWSTAVTAGDVIGFNVDSAATVERVTLTLEVTT